MKTSDGTALVYYNEAKTALARVHRVDEVKSIPAGVSGVYIFRDDQEILYVGEFKCLRTRLSRSHERKRQFKKLKIPNIFLEVIFCSNHKELEQLLIKDRVRAFVLVP